MSYNIALIGAGQLGSRHLQGLKTIQLVCKIAVVDPNFDSLRIAKERFEQLSDNNNIIEIKYLSTIDDIENIIDLCIISTNSSVRSQITEEIIKKKKVKSILFEKILFQKIEDYTKITDIINKHEIKAWVNCPRRLYYEYISLKKILNDNSKLTFLLSGGEWGLACNSIHFIDLLAYFTNNIEFQFTTESLDKKIHKSKRDGYIELTGTLVGEMSNGSKIILNSVANSNSPHIITINGDKIICIIDETNGEIRISSQESEWKWEIRKIDILYQSQLTGKIAEDIILTNKCGLTSFADSVKLHIPFISSILEFYNKVEDENSDICPIT